MQGNEAGYVAADSRRADAPFFEDKKNGLGPSNSGDKKNGAKTRISIAFLFISTPVPLRSKRGSQNARNSNEGLVFLPSFKPPEFEQPSPILGGKMRALAP